MNNIIDNIPERQRPAWLSLLLFAAFIVTSCADDVSLPAPVIRLDLPSITAPSLQSTFSVDIESNCDWSAEITDQTSHDWITISQSSDTGNGVMSFTLKPNDSSSTRETSIDIHNKSRSASTVLKVIQNPSSGDGMVTVGQLRLLEGSASTPDRNAVTRGVVVSDLQHRNFPEKLIAIVGSAEPGNGIAVRTREDLLIGLGEEIEVSLDGAGISRDRETGLLILTPRSDADISRTEATAIIPTPVEASVSDLATGKYESMYVKVPGQLSAGDIAKEYLYECTSFGDEDGGSIGFTVLPGCSFAEAMIPTGSGYICGVVSSVDGSPSIYPGRESDIALNGSRFDGGFTLPYVFSLMTNTATNNDGRYIETLRNPDDNNLTAAARPLDDSGVMVEWKVNSTNQYFRFWTDTSGHHNFQLGSWFGLQENYLTASYPAGLEFKEGFRVQFGWAGMTNGLRNWEVLYSTDGVNWSAGKEPTTFSIPKNMVGTGGKGYPFFTVDVYVDRPITRDDQLRVMIRPLNNETISGGAFSGASCRAIFHSCLILDCLPAGTRTAMPGGAKYFEAFDGLTEGADYRLGDRLSAMLNYAGPDIADWTPDQLNSMTGSNVRQRPGYAQIGYVNSIDNSHSNYVNEVGQLTTPALGCPGTISLSFKAMAYKNKAVFSGAKDRNGDMTSGMIEIIGGGSINGLTTMSFGPMSYDSFKNFEFKIEGAVDGTQIRFTSSPGSAEYSRWFIDNICVK